MKHIFSRFMTLLLTVVMIMEISIVVSFADEAITDVFASGDSADVFADDAGEDALSDEFFNILPGAGIGHIEVLSAESNPSGVQIEWEDYPGADGYSVYRKVGNKSSWTKIASTDESEYLDITAKAGKINTYSVRAFVRSGREQNIIGFSSEDITCRYSDPVRMDVARKMLQLGIKTLRDAYDYTASLEYKDHENGHTVEWYANRALKYDNADCYTKAAIFCWMARELGYNARVADGYVRLEGGDINIHGWVEIIEDGRTYVYDPEFQQEFPDKNGFKIIYGQKDTWVYMDWEYMEEY